MEDERIEIPWWGWVLMALAAAGAFLLAWEAPGTFAYWLCPLLFLPLLGGLVVRFLSPWFETPVSNRVAGWAIGFGLAVVAAPLAIVDPSRRTWLIAELLVLPLVAVVVARLGDAEESGSGAPLDPTWDTPDF